MVPNQVIVKRLEPSYILQEWSSFFSVGYIITLHHTIKNLIDHKISI